MRIRSTIFHPVVIFVSAQLAWLSLLGLWINWYVSNYVVIEKVGDRISPQLISKSTNITTLVVGIILLVAILMGIYLIFFYLNRQKNINKLYDNFIANVTHELKSPLASIQMYLETLQIRDVPREKHADFVRFMLKDVDRLKRLINSILEISALEQKKVAHNFHVFVAEKLCKTLIKEAIEQFKLDEKTVKVEGSTNSLCVIDKDALKIVFDNLIENALKYSHGTFHLTITLRETTKKFCIDFTDQGIGISLKDQAKLFNKFHRVYHSQIPNVRGTGLGLYWVREIIRIHGGKVTVFSRGLFQGTTFKIELPIYQSDKRRYVNYLLKLTSKRAEKQQPGIVES